MTPDKMKKLSEKSNAVETLKDFENIADRLNIIGSFILKMSTIP